MSDRRTVASILVLTIWRTLGLFLSVAVAGLIAALFGANGATDAFLFARRVTSGLSAGLERSTQLLMVPGLVHALRLHGRGVVAQSMRRRYWRVALVAVVFTAALIAAAPLLVAVAAPGLSPDDRQLSVACLRIMALALPLSAYSAMQGATLNAFRRFSLPAIARLMPRVGMAVVLVLMTPSFGFMAMSVANVLGSLAMAAIIVIAIVVLHRGKASGEQPVQPDAAAVAADGEAVPQLGVRQRIWPMSIGQIHMTGAAWVDLAFASMVGPGGVSVLEFGQRITNLAPGVVSNSISSVYYTEFAAAVSEGRPQVFMRHLARALRFTLFSALPVAIALVLLSDVLVATLLHRGSFSHEAARNTAAIISILAPGLAVNAFLASITSALIADAGMPQTRIVVIATGVSISLRVGLDYFLVPVMGVVAVPLASLIAMTVLLVLLYAMASARWGRILQVEDLKTLGLILLCGCVAALAGFVARTVLFSDPSGNFFRHLLVLCVVGSTVMLSYGASAYLFRLEEMRWVEGLARRARRLVARPGSEVA